MKPRIMKKEGFKALGLKWQGKFEEASQGGIQKLFLELREVTDGIENKAEPGIVKGLSYHNLTGGFTYYLCQEVNDIGEIRYGLEIIEVPAYTYAVLEHKGAEVMNSYGVLYQWIEEQGYSLNQQILQHLEEYPADYHPYEDEPNLLIHIPVEA
ncbi:GyrI-like domain-containing protein [Bacillus sp. P14.5]|uniref:GyrI-like domain-containing protein n=1 Tax=Bacillus sp. P14.5 TaxID=1983400 RepID=UPI000DE81C6A|nr:GyrI-like domain-containing protein [Bacillus sp. P14.5]